MEIGLGEGPHVGGALVKALQKQINDGGTAWVV